MKSIFRMVVFCLLAAAPAVFAQTSAETGGATAETSQTLDAAAQTSLQLSRAISADFNQACNLLAAKDLDGYASATTRFLQAYPDAPAVQRAELEFGLASVPYIQSNWTQARAALDQFAATHAGAADLAEAQCRAVLISRRGAERF
jgi:outer membrane protein assembly factor BamD (BamD/ComL family)